MQPREHSQQVKTDIDGVVSRDVVAIEENGG